MNTILIIAAFVVAFAVLWGLPIWYMLRMKGTGGASGSSKASTMAATGFYGAGL